MLYNVYSKADIDIGINLSSAQLNTYLKSDVDVCVIYFHKLGLIDEF